MYNKDQIINILKGQKKGIGKKIPYFGIGIIWVIRERG